MTESPTGHAACRGGYLLLELLPGAQHVWRAERRAGPNSGKPVALRRGAGGPVRMAPSLTHVNLAAPLDGGIEAGEPWATTELVEGLSLARLLGAGPIGPVAAAFIVAEAARGLAFLHGLRPGGVMLLHRRISPRTVLVGTAGEVKLCGLEEVLRPRRETLEQRADAEGPWVAPEQRHGEPLDGRCDVYALGAVLRTALPEARDDEQGQDGELGDVLRRIAERCCQTDRAARYPTATALRETLLAVLRGSSREWGRAELAALVAARLPLAASWEALVEDEQSSDGFGGESEDDPVDGPGDGASGASKNGLQPDWTAVAATKEAGLGPSATRVLSATEAPAAPEAAGSVEVAAGAGWRRWAVPVAGLAVLVASVALPVLHGTWNKKEDRPAFGGDAVALLTHNTASPSPSPLPSPALSLGPLRLRLRHVERTGDALVLDVRLTNPTRQPAPVPLREARLDGDLPAPTLSPDAAILPADSVLDLRLRFAPLPDAAAPTALRLPGGALPLDLPSARSPTAPETP